MSYGGFLLTMVPNQFIMTPPFWGHGDCDMNGVVPPSDQPSLSSFEECLEGRFRVEAGPDTFIELTLIEAMALPARGKPCACSAILDRLPRSGEPPASAAFLYV